MGLMIVPLRLRIRGCESSIRVAINGMLYHGNIINDIIIIIIIIIISIIIIIII